MSRGIHFTIAQGAARPRELSTNAIREFIERWNPVLGLIERAAEIAEPAGLFDADALDRAVWDLATQILGTVMVNARYLRPCCDECNASVWGTEFRRADPGLELGPNQVQIRVRDDGLVIETLEP